MIYGIFSNDSERPLIRGTAYRALCRSENIEWKDIVPAPSVVDSSTEIDRGILERVERRLGRRFHYSVARMKLSILALVRTETSVLRSNSDILGHIAMSAQR
jgi:hypothetical protein